MLHDYLGYIPDYHDLIKLLLSIVAGGLIGAEREYRSKAAGFRTMVLICVGSTLFTIYSTQLGEHSSPDRMAANIITGIGFLGAGAIFRDTNNVTRGLTTAAVIWMTAAVGVGIGSGNFILVLLTMALLLLILASFPYLESLIDKKHQVRVYKIHLVHREQIAEMETLFASCELKASRLKHIRKEGRIVSSWQSSGSEKAHNHFVNHLFLDSNITDFEF